MKILMITPYLPYPLLSGGQIRSYNLLKNLSKKHKITLFSFIRDDNERVHIKKLTKYCQLVKVFKRRKAWDIKNIILAGFTPYPFLVSIYFSLTLRKAITEELNNGNYDLIHAETFYVMPNIPKTKTPILLVEQTIEYLVYQNFVDNLKFLPIKPLLYFDVMKIRVWEKHYWRQATRLVAMSDEDKKIMGQAVPNKNIDIVANGVDINLFTKTKIQRPKRPTVLFVGNFKWLPNKDAAWFLTYKIWPKIKKKIPQSRLWIVGRNPTSKILSLSKQKDVLVDGGVDDIRDAFGQASVLLAPIRNGRGTKYKVLEAMASKLPVVSTPLGVDGIDVKDNDQVLIASQASDLAEKTIKILKDQQLGKKIAKSAFWLIKNKYNWQIIASSLDKVYRKLGQSN